MEVKKSDKANIDKNSLLYLLLGVNVALGLILLLFNYKQYDSVPIVQEEPEVVEAATEAVLIEIPEPELPPPPPPKADEPPPPPPPVVPQEIEETPEPVPPPPIKDQNEPTPPVIPTTTKTTGPVAKVNLDNLKKKTKKTDEGRETAPVTVNRVAKMAVYPGCEKVQGDKRKSMACFGEKLGKDILRYLDTEFPDVDKPAVAVQLEFHVDKKGYITNITPKRGDNEFKPEAKRALEKTAEYLRRKNKLIKPAEMSDGSKAILIFTQPVKLSNPDY